MKGFNNKDYLRLKDFNKNYLIIRRLINIIARYLYIVASINIGDVILRYLFIDINEGDIIAR